MRIGIDARFYGPSAKGLGRYVQKLLEHLEQMPSGHSFVVFLRKDGWDAYQPKSPRFQKVLADIPWYTVAEQMRLPGVLRSQHLDLMHFPHYNVPLLYRGAFVITIHDLIVSRYPTKRASTLGPVKMAVKRMAYKTVLRSAIHRSRTILTVSNFSKQELLRDYRVPPEKIIVTYEATEQLTHSSVPADLRGRFAALAPYCIYVGNAYPHKNLEGLLAAYVLLKQRMHPAPKLVLVGKEEYFYRRIKEEAARLGLDDTVVFTGFLDDAGLTAALEHASLYVFPSFDEGFGLPPLEAMQAGVPVASSNRSCLPEVLGDAAAYFDPAQPASIAEVVQRVLTHPGEQAHLRQRGFAQVRKYSWATLARKTLDVYTKSGMTAR